MAKLNFQSLLPRTTITYSARNVSFTIDMIFVTAQLAEKVDECRVYQCNHSSDHTVVNFFSIYISAPPQTLQFVFKHTLWATICKKIRNGTAKIDTSPQDIDKYNEQLMRIVTENIDKYITRAKPDPYGKRW